jgi:hypothetical protein
MDGRCRDGEAVKVIAVIQISADKSRCLRRRWGNAWIEAKSNIWGLMFF